MNNSKVVILGAGHVGSHAAHAIARKGICTEIVLVDTDRDKAVSQALDIDDSLHGDAADTLIRAGGHSEVADAAIVINAIGEGRKPGQTRLDLLARSVELSDILSAQLQPHGVPGIFISVTNPCDVIADYMRRSLSLPRERAFGTGTLLDTARLVRAISRKTGVRRNDILAYCLGEHGDSSMIPFDTIRIKGEHPVSYGISCEELLDETHSSGMVIIEGKKSTEYGIGEACAILTKCILLDEKKVLPVSVLLEGEYDESGVHAGVPCVIGRNGIESVIVTDMTADEKAAFHRSCDIIRDHIRRADI